MAVLCIPAARNDSDRDDKELHLSDRRISTRIMTTELQSCSDVIGHLAFHYIVATISSAISTKNRDCFPLGENT